MARKPTLEDEQDTSLLNGLFHFLFFLEVNRSQCNVTLQQTMMLMVIFQV